MMNVFQKIIETKKVVKNFLKDAETSGKGSYTYTSGSQILSAIKEKMEEIGLLFLPVETEHRGWTTFNYKNSYGDEKTDFIVEGKLCYEWINAEDPTDRQRVSFEYYGQQNDISKAFGSALTYSERYLLLKSLGAPTDEDDPDKHTEDKAQKKPATKAPTTATPQKTPQERRKKSKWAEVNELIKDSDITLASVNEWILKAFGKTIKINNLSDEQFAKLMKALRTKIGEEAQ